MDTGGLRLEQGSVTVEVTSTGAPRSLVSHERQLLLYPATELEDGLAGLWLRVRTGSDVEPSALVGTASGPEVCRAAGSALVRTGVAGGLRWSWSLRLLEDRAGWSWEVEVTNEREEPVEVDLLHAQDVALSAPEVLAASTLYPSQYLDLTPVDLGPRGTAVAVRQNMPGPTAPWCLVGCHGRASRCGTDLLQLTGRGLPEGAPWPGLRTDLPAERLQHEHAAVLLQTEPVTLAPGETWRTGFFGVVLADHPAATSDADAAHAEGIAMTTACPVVQEAPTGHAVGGASLVGSGAAYLPVRELTDTELDELAPGDRRHVETEDGRVLSWFDADGAHLVTAAKQAAVLRPHGQVLRPLHGLLPGERDVTSTVWMDGSFCSHLTVGHAALGRTLSLRPSPLGLGRVHGLRVAVDLGDGWQLLGTPSLWRSAVDGATWWYAVPDRLLRVTVIAPDAGGASRVTVDTLDGEPVPAMVLLTLDWSGAGRVTGHVEPRPGGVTVTAPEGALPGTDGGRLDVALTGADLEQVGDDGPLFTDGQSRGEPVVTLRLAPAATWAVEVMATIDGTPATATDPAPEACAGGYAWPTVDDLVQLEADGIDPATTPAATTLARLDAITGWYAHDALVHYLSPRGLEQHTGGAWGTRDVCQGPVGLLRSWAAHDDWRALLLTVFRGQHERGDWPQAFDFLPSHRRDVVDTAHGDVVYWPLLALGQYLLATGDHAVLEEEVAFTGDGAPGGTAPLAEHVRRALTSIEATFVDGTALPAYGHGDWNDSLQPADPDLAARMVSTWTVVLQAEALGRLADGTGTAYPEIAERARGIAEAGVRDLRTHLLVDGVLSGYGVSDGEGGFAPLIHPRDERTGLRYSVLPMIHAVAGDLLTPDEARAHLDLVAEHLTGPDGARLFDRPVGYRGGPTEIFQRAEAATFFGREIGIMYVHAHLRYAEALARVGDGPGLLHALAQAVPVGIEEAVPSAAPRQANAYSSSSDAWFADRYEAERDYDRVLSGEVPLEAGWRVYSSGPGLFLEVLTQRMLGVRHAGEELELDPVLDPALGTVRAHLPLGGGHRLELEVVCGSQGHGVRSVRSGGEEIPARPLTNPYREPGVAVPLAAALAAAEAGRPLVLTTG